jgi:hypothetical protein
MKLRSGHIIDKVDNIQNDFVSLFYSIKSGYKYTDL